MQAMAFTQYFLTGAAGKIFRGEDEWEKMGARRSDERKEPSGRTSMGEKSEDGVVLSRNLGECCEPETCAGFRTGAVQSSTFLLGLHSEINCRRSWSKVCHLGLNMLPHYFAKPECSNVQLFIDIS